MRADAIMCMKSMTKAVTGGRGPAPGRGPMFSEARGNSLRGEGRASFTFLGFKISKPRIASPVI